MASVTRPVRLAALALVLAGGIVACGGDDDGAEAPAGPHPLGTPIGESDPAVLCTAVLNERDADVFEAGRDASLDVVLWAQQEGPPSAEAAEAGAEAMEALRDAFAADREALEAAEVDDPAVWEDVLAGLDQQVETLEERIAVVEADDWDGAISRLELGAGPPEEVAVAVEELDLVGRDCEVLTGYAGATEDDAEFVAGAANACATVVARRRAGTFATDAEVSLGVLEAVYTDQEVEVDDAVIEGVDRLRAEWEETADDLDAVAAEDAIDPDGWRQVVEVAGQRAAGYAGRVEALEDGDQAEIAEAFDPAVLGDPAFDGFEANGLDLRECRSIQA